MQWNAMKIISFVKRVEMILYHFSANYYYNVKQKIIDIYIQGLWSGAHYHYRWVGLIVIIRTQSLYTNEFSQLKKQLELLYHG